jgi:acyl-[acyl-carrier-protein]-phospholipid O-acyltransferase / long-chain-fatty-acid--[acyl-carrier-protein] ligase
METSSGAAFDPQAARTTLFGALLDARDRFGRDAPALEDPERNPLSFGRLAFAALVLGRRLARLTRLGERVGVLLPSAQGTIVTLFALNVFGRVPAMLNFTAGLRNLKAACETAGLRTLLTSHRFVEAAKLDDVVEALGEGRQVVWLEDVREAVTSWDKLVGLLESWRARAVIRRSGSKPDDEAVILFTSGSEGVPKGVVLSNANLVANARQVFALAEGAIGPSDTFFNPLPVFHSFGLTAGVLTGLLNGSRVVLYPSPLHYRQVPKLIGATKATVLLATDTFLQGYAKAAGEGDLGSVRLVIAGAERVRDETRRLWGGAGAVILEGYGATECAPVIACNAPWDNRPGTVGPFLPGIAWRLQPVAGIADAGRLEVRGPNVMKGYIGATPDAIEPPPDGWHDTGDVVSVAGGFVTIRGRAKRFAKIGGEMVSLAAVEALAQGLWPEFHHVVVSLPDPRKGEQLALVTDKPGADRDALLAHARAQGYPELWAPKAVLVAPIPMLGSGKIDYPAAVEMARSLRPML